MLHGVAGLRVYGVGIFLSVFDVEVAIVSAGCHCLVFRVDDGLQLFFGCGILNRFADSDFPFLSVWISAVCDDFPSNFDHEVFHIVLEQEFCHAVHAVAFCNRSEVNRDARFVFLQGAVRFECQVPASHELSEAVNVLLCGERSAFIAESPGVDQRHDGHIKCAIGLFRHLHGFLQRAKESKVCFVRFSSVEAGDGALGIEDGKALIDSLQFLSDRVVKCLGAFIFNVIDRAEDGSFCGAQGGSPSEVQNPDGAGDEQQEEEDSGDGAESGALFHSVLQVQMSMRMCSEPPKACPSFFPKPGTYHGLPTAEGLLLMRNL